VNMSDPIKEALGYVRDAMARIKDAGGVTMDADELAEELQDIENVVVEALVVKLALK